MPKVMHYRKKCIGCNSCVEHAPDFWKMSEEDGKSVLRDAVQKKDFSVLKINNLDLEKNELAARDCPARIIKISKK